MTRRLWRSRRFGISLALLAMAAFAPAQRICGAQKNGVAAPQAADVVLINGKILTVNAKDSIVEAVAIQEGKITAVRETRTFRAPWRKRRGSSTCTGERPRRD